MTIDSDDAGRELHASELLCQLKNFPRDINNQTNQKNSRELKIRSKQMRGKSHPYKMFRKNNVKKIGTGNGKEFENTVDVYVQNFELQEKNNKLEENVTLLQLQATALRLRSTILEKKYHELYSEHQMYKYEFACASQILYNGVQYQQAYNQ